MTDMLKGENVTVRYGSHTAVDDLSFTLEQGQWLMLVGPNGAGKSTLIEAIAQGVPYTGRMELEGLDARAYRPAQLARKVGVLSQRHSVSYAYTVEEVVQLGRYAHSRNPFGSGDDEGRERVEQALGKTGLREMRHASVLTLSGGELQRVFLAQLFAQAPQILLLDEPANHLDLVYQKQIFSLIREWLAQPGRAVLSVVHDLSLARAYGTHAVLMQHGRCVSQGPLDRVLTPENLQQVYGMDVYGWMQDMLKKWQTP